MTERVNRADDAYYAWHAIRPRAFIRGDAIDIYHHGIGSYRLTFDFAVPGVVVARASDAVGPSADPELLARVVAAANAAAGRTVFEISGPFVTCGETLPRGQGGILVSELEAARVHLVGLLDAHHVAFAAPGRLPFAVHVDDSGHATMTVKRPGPRADE